MRGIGYIFGGVLLCAVLVWISGPSFAQDIVATVGTPVLDGAASPGEWPTGAATDSVLTTTGVTIKAMVDNVYVYILAQWADDSGTESVHKKRWTFDGTSWSQSGNEDRVAMVWDMGLNGTQGANCATMCHPNTPGKDNDMYTDTGEVDVWHWKAARTNPMGYVDDKYWKPYPGDESATRKGDGGNNTYDDNGPVGSGYPADMAVGDPGAQATFLYRSGMAFDPFGVIDAGLGHEAVVFDSLAAWSAGDVVPGYSLEDPDGSRGDVEAAGDYQNGVWTVEMRRLHAGTSHDFEVRPGGSVDFAVAEFDNAGGMNHTMDTNVYTLRFPQFLPPDYVGSSSCALCHSSTHSDWEQTLHHIMLQDTSGILTQEATGVSVFDPRAPGYDTYVEGVFPSTPPIDDVSYTIGSHWKQRYLKEMGGDEFAILPAQWVVKTQEWGAYHAAVWDAEGRRWGKKCAGCHTTGYTPSGVNTPAGTFNEMGVGCETCHGPGSDHTDSMDPADIVNPEELAFDRANEVCGQCHYRGSSSAGYYGFAWNETDDSRFLPGEVLADHITESPGLWPDGMTSTKHHQQWLDWKNSEHSRHDVGCISCHDPHAETEYGHQLKLDNDDNSLCTSCHGDLADPAAATAHSGHSYDPENQNETGGTSRCSKCHMPKVAKSATSYDIHSHTFEVISPQKTLDYQAVGGMPNSCAVSCHRNPQYANIPDFGITDATLTDWTEETDIQLAQILSPPVVEITVKLSAGWNMISLPVTPTDASVSALFPGAVAALFWDGFRYVPTDRLQTGRGYWVAVAEDTMYTVRGIGLTSYTTHLRPGWNMIGSVIDPVDFSNPLDIPDNSIVPRALYYYDRREGGYLLSPEIRPSVGYWVASIQPATLMVGALPPPPKAFAGEQDLASFYRIYGDSPPPPPVLSSVAIPPVPVDFSLSQNYPNPFNPETEITYAIPGAGRVSLKIYNLLGHAVRTLVDEPKESGYYSVTWDGRNERGDEVSSGVYFYQIRAGEFASVKKMVLMK